MAENTKIIISAVDKTRRGFSSVTSGLKKVSGAVFNLKTALLGTVGAAGFGLLVKSSLQATDQLAKTASKIGTTTEALSQLRFAADLTGVATQTMDMALQRFTRRAAEAAKGTGEAKNAIRELGINAQDLVKLPLDQRMLVLADAFSNVENESDKLRLAFKLFDSEGAALVNTLSLGRDELEKLFGEARSLGIVMSSDAAKGVENANDALTRLGSLFRGVTDQTVAALAPAIALLTETFKNFVLTGISEANGSIQEFAKALAVDILNAIGTTLKGLENLVNGVIDTFNKIVAASDRFTGFFKDDDQKNARQLRQEIEQLNLAIEGRSGASPRMQKGVENRNEIDRERIAVLEKLLETAKDVNDFQIDRVSFGTTAQQAIQPLIDIIQEANEVTDNLVEKVADKAPSAFQVLLETMKNLRPQAKDVTESLAEIANKAIDGLGKAFTDAITGAKKFSDAIRSMAKSVIDSLIQMLIQKYLVDAAFSGITSFFNQNSSTGGTGSALSQAQKAGFGVSGDGGGYTGMGARAGGIDGKGGFPAILHPNESIIDHAKGQSMGVTVQQTINISTGVQSTVRSELVQLLPQIAAVTRSSVADARLRGGSFSKAMVGA